MIIRSMVAVTAAICATHASPPGSHQDAARPVRASIQTITEPTPLWSHPAMWRVRTAPEWGCAPANDGQYAETYENGVVRAWKCKVKDGVWQWVEVARGDFGLCYPHAMQDRATTRCDRHR